ncbi:MAG: hypothetical protein PHP98_04865 [Kiritimatiellae bacterium]|nr:hypothetical protein [Kiritimatiellia bacterium]
MKYLTTIVSISLMFSTVSRVYSEPAPASNAAPVIAFEFYNSYCWPKALELFSEYKNNLRQGRFDKAAATQALIYSLLATNEEQTRFWQKVIPDGQRQVLEIYQICPDCKNGHCPACNGKGGCPLCQGKKYCLECQGKGSFSKKCTACQCRRCGASGVCQICWGYKILKCPACKGTGMANRELGQKCPQCGGKGRVNCTECGGSGKCPVCAGKGRVRNCPQCGGKGVVITSCLACSGTGQCLCCQNSGVCPVCKGSGVCPRCGQKGIIMRYRFPVQNDWTRVSPGIILRREQPVATNQIFKNTGAVNIAVGSHNLNLNIQPDEIFCISDTERFDWIKNQVLQ